MFPAKSEEQRNADFLTETVNEECSGISSIF